MNLKRLLLILTAIAATAAAAFCTEPADSTTIADRINASAASRVIQPEKLNARLVRSGSHSDGGDKDATAAAPTGGYRIQVYSGNNARTSKNEAQARASKISSRFPEHATYVNYDAPYWRLRVGDFRNYEDARAAMGMLKKEYPAYAREMRLVRDRIKL